MLFSFHYVNFIPVDSSLFLVSNLIALSPQNIACVILVLLNVLRLVLWPTVWFILVHITCALEKDVYPAIVGYSALSVSIR
jgi:hypothetical protein